MAIPNELKERPRWVCYKLMPDKDGGKPRKVPVDPVTGKGAKSNDPSTWSDYQTAVNAYEMYGYSGLGFMFTKEDGFVGVDIDHCYDAKTNTFNAAAAAILAKLPTYAEFSPSGDGVHLWFQGEKPEGGSKNSNTGVEMYDSVRYFTVTGKKLADAPEQIAGGEKARAALAWIHETYVSKKKKSSKAKRKPAAVSAKLTDEELLEKAMSAKDGEEFTMLWEGRWQEKFKSQSEADIVLCRKLAFWSGKDKGQMDRLFRQSALYRDKWDRRHYADGSTYGGKTLEQAIKTTEAIYDPADTSPIYEANGRYYRVRGDTVYPLTNFVIHPVEMVKSEDETQITADFVTITGGSYRLTVMSTDFTTAQRFKAQLNKTTIALAYFGTDGDIELLKEYVSRLEWQIKWGVRAAGVYEHGGRMVFVVGDLAVDKDGLLVGDLLQMVKHREIETELLKTDPLSKADLLALGRVILGFNEPAKTVPLIGWICGCFIKEHLRINAIKYPHLFLIGEAGSGKSTTMEKVLKPIFGAGSPLAATQVTAFTLLKVCSSSNLVPLFMDEFKPSTMDKQKISVLYNHFRDSYDGHAGKRGKMDQATVSYDLLAPMVVAGEESADETAIRERSIELLFSKKDLKDRMHRAAYNEILGMERQMRDLGRTLLMQALATEKETVLDWYKEGWGHFDVSLPDRIRNNLSAIYAGVKLLEAVCGRYGLSWDEVFPYQLDVCARYMEFAMKDFLLDGGTHNQSVLEQTFEIMARIGLDPKSEYVVSDDGKVLYLQFPKVYDLFTKYCKDYALRDESLKYAEFKKQLMHSDLYLDSNVAKRLEGRVMKFWLVDFEKLSQRCDVTGFVGEDIKPM